MSGCARQDPPGSSLAAELMSMSADDWAACLFAADAGRLSCPLLDCFFPLRRRHLELGFNQLSSVKRGRARRVMQVSLLFADAVWLISCPPFLLPAGL